MLSLSKNSRSALLIVDMQEFFFREPERRVNLKAVIHNINRLIGRFEARSWPVFHVISAYKADGSDWDLKMRLAGIPELIEGSQETAILPGVRILESHTTIVKTRYSAFFKTNLAELLQARKIERAVVAGAYTHYCVNATIFDAYCYDFVPCIITDAVLSHIKVESELMIDRMRRNGYQVFSTQEFLTEMECN
jgi:maleamate amidohydrolase